MRKFVPLLRGHVVRNGGVVMDETVNESLDSVDGGESQGDGDEPQEYVYDVYVPVEHTWGDLPSSTLVRTGIVLFLCSY